MIFIPKAYAQVQIPSYNITSWVQVAHVIINVLLLVVGVASVVGLIIGGYQYITSQGNPDAAKTAKATIFASIIALVIAGAAYAAVAFIYKYLGK